VGSRFSSASRLKLKEVVGSRFSSASRLKLKEVVGSRAWRSRLKLNDVVGSRVSIKPVGAVELCELTGH